MVNRRSIINYVLEFHNTSDDNWASLSDSSDRFTIFDEPLFGFASARDHYFELLKQPQVIGSHYRLPNDWLPSAETVISIFFPFTKEVRESNKADKHWPSDQWLYGRIEGQVFLNRLSKSLEYYLKRHQVNAIVPSINEKFIAKTSEEFTSNWSERHTAYACGLGTFGLSKGLITRKGMAGRLCSVIIDLPLPADTRDYTGVYEYCNRCGRCIKNCPVHAISFENGKDHLTCSRFLDRVLENHNPRYGCGKCQVNVPCEYEIPRSR